MNPSPPELNPEQLEQALRDGAAQRRALLAEQVYPVGDYPPRNATPRAHAAGPGWLPRLALLLGLGGVATAGLLLAVTLLNQVSQPDRADEKTIVLNIPQLEGLGDTVGSLFEGLERAERTFGRHLEPTIAAATAWPVQLGELPATLDRAEQRMQAPIEQELAALQQDMRAAADYFRRQWRAPAADGPAGRLEALPASGNVVSG